MLEKGRPSGGLFRCVKKAQTWYTTPMPMESLSRPPALESKENNEPSLERQLEQFQLAYVGRVWEKKIPSVLSNEGREVTFENLLMAITDIPHRIFVEERKRNGGTRNYTEGQADLRPELERAVFAKIHAAYDADPVGWIAKVDGIIKASLEEVPVTAKATIREAVNSVGRTLPLGVQRRILDKIHPGRKRETAGVLEYQVNIDDSACSHPGVRPGEQYISIHLPDLYRQKKSKKEIQNIFSSSSLKQLAKDMAEKYPDAVSVNAQSWLLDTPIGERAGFHSAPSEHGMEYLDRFFWGQFITQDGQLDPMRVKQLLETGVPPYRVLQGYIPREEFLAKYLPSNEGVIKKEDHA